MMFQLCMVDWFDCFTVWMFQNSTMV